MDVYDKLDLDSVENIIDKIRNLSSVNSEKSGELYVEIIEDINKITDENTKKQLYNELIIELKDMLRNSAEIEDEEKLNKFIEDIRNNILSLHRDKRDLKYLKEFMNYDFDIKQIVLSCFVPAGKGVHLHRGGQCPDGEPAGGSGWKNHVPPRIV